MTQIYNNPAKIPREKLCCRLSGKFSLRLDVRTFRVRTIFVAPLQQQLSTLLGPK